MAGPAPGEPAATPRVVAVVAARRGAPAAAVAAAIVEGLAAQLSVVAPGRVDAAGLAWLAAELARGLIFTGFVDDADLPAAYAAADVFVNAGTAELQSLVILEAMASGLPVLGADASALPHLVHHDHNGFLFPPGDHDRLVRLMEGVEDIPFPVLTEGLPWNWESFL